MRELRALATDSMRELVSLMSCRSPAISCRWIRNRETRRPTSIPNRVMPVPMTAKDDLGSVGHTDSLAHPRTSAG